jgi:predicted nucleotidyltransferase
MDISDIQKKATPILKNFGIQYAAIFGSVSRGDDNAKSDIDLLVRLGKPMGLFSYMKFIRTLEESLGRDVDVVTEKSLNKFIKPYVTQDLKTIYEK